MGRGGAAYVAAGASLGITAHGLVRMARFAAARHAPPRVSTSGAAPVTSVSAVVPARDEARTIGRCVAALCATGSELLEVVVVDDWSTDGTAAAARHSGDARVRTIAAAPLVPGDLGKPAACAAGAAAATGEWLLFVDADVAVAPDAVRRLLALADESGAELVSALGRLDASSAGTAWLLPEVGLALSRRLDLDSVADPTSPAAFASGQCLLVSRRAYDELGGHRAVVREPVEDLALARLAKARGIRQRLTLAPDLYAVRMYDDVAGTWRGLLKNSRAVRGSRPADVAREVALAAAAVGPAVLSLGPPSAARRLARLAVAGQVLVSAGGRAVARVPVWPAPLAPAAEVVLAASWAAGVLAHRSGGEAPWRGRHVPVG